MTKFNQAVLAAASSIALFGGAMTLITPAANAWDSSCRTNSFGRTTCSGSDGSSYTGRTNSFGTTRFSGTDSYGNDYSGSCRTNSFGTTRCSGY
tara:strand:- start:336 stop:617 length:282 start_codon:yes stop_codon:yes gene_type:complete